MVCFNVVDIGGVMSEVKFISERHLEKTVSGCPTKQGSRCGLSGEICSSTSTERLIKRCPFIHFLLEFNLIELI